MDFSALFTSTTGETLTLGNTILIILASLGLGAVISLIYLLTHRQEGYAKSFPVTLIMLPVIISIIILLVGNSIARAFSLAGTFTLVRFRSTPGDPKDIAYVFFTMAAGLACGIGYIGYALLFTVILSAVMLLLHFTHYGAVSKNNVLLKITVPEDLNYAGLFDDLFQIYTTHWTLVQVKTSGFGTLFRLTYHITIKEGMDQKEFLDSLRCRNGNLDISLALHEENPSF